MSRRDVLRFKAMFFGYSSVAGAHSLIVDACVLSFWMAALRKGTALYGKGATTTLHQKESRCIGGTALRLRELHCIERNY